RFEMAEANSGNAPDMARAGALQLVKQQNAKAIITDSSQDDIAVNMLNYDGDASHQLDVPIVCMACTSPAIDNPEARDADPVRQAALRNGKRWNFRTTMSDAYQARMLVQMLASAGKKGDVNGDGKFKLSIYASDDPYGHGFSDAIRADALKARPGALIEQVFHDAAAYDAAMAVMLAVVQAAEQRHFKDPGMVSGAEIRDAMRSINDPRGEPVGAGAGAFLRALQLTAAGKSIDYQGASGPCDFDEHGDVVAQLARFQVQGGLFVDVDRFDCVKDAACPQVQRRAQGR